MGKINVEKVQEDIQHDVNNEKVEANPANAPGETEKDVQHDVNNEKVEANPANVPGESEKDIQHDVNNKKVETNTANIPEEAKKSKKKKLFSRDKNEQTEEIAKLKTTINELNDKLLRNAAEFDNFKKRTLKEKYELLRFGSETILLDILSVIDDFERAYKSINESTDIEAIKAGVTLIYSKFNEFITRQGVKEISAINQEFSTDLHEAVTRFPSPSEEMKGKIIDVIQKGYTLNDKVIRFAKVIVGE